MMARWRRKRYHSFILKFMLRIEYNYERVLFSNLYVKRLYSFLSNNPNLGIWEILIYFSVIIPKGPRARLLVMMEHTFRVTNYLIALISAVLFRHYIT